jgi:hypothetical protein
MGSEVRERVCLFWGVEVNWVVMVSWREGHGARQWRVGWGSFGFKGGEVKDGWGHRFPDGFGCHLGVNDDVLDAEEDGGGVARVEGRHGN